MITLTDMSDSSGSAYAGSGGVRRLREQILYSEDFDAIQDYLQDTDSPMLTLSPSWLCRGGGPDSSLVHVFPPAVSRDAKPRPPGGPDASLVDVSPPRVNRGIRPHLPAPPTMTSHSSSTIDMSSSIGSASSSLHAREVCFLFYLFLLCSLIGLYLFCCLLLVFC